MSLATIWEQLEGELPEGMDGRMMRRVHAESAMDIFVWSQSREPRRALELQVPTSDATLELPVGTRGISMSRQVVNDATTALVLELTDASAVELFGVVCTDIAAVVSRCNETAAATATWVGRYNRWRRLLERAPKGLTGTRQRGLFAELWVLREIFARNIGITDAVASWVGPDKAARDFEWAGRAVEVKSSATNEPQLVTINGERQLDDAQLESLHLVHLSLEILPGSGETLPQMVSSVRALAAGGPAEAQLSDALLESGYADHHAELYEHMGYAVRRLSILKVGEGFPRITEKDLDDGVGSVTYKLVIDACREHEISQEALQQELGTHHGE